MTNTEQKEMTSQNFRCMCLHVGLFCLKVTPALVLYPLQTNITTKTLVWTLQLSLTWASVSRPAMTYTSPCHLPRTPTLTHLKLWLADGVIHNLLYGLYSLHVNVAYWWKNIGSFTYAKCLDEIKVCLYKVPMVQSDCNTAYGFTLYTWLGSFTKGGF